MLYLSGDCRCGLPNSANLCSALIIFDKIQANVGQGVKVRLTCPTSASCILNAGKQQSVRPALQLPHNINDIQYTVRHL
jgi:hypothetical protein